jgi:hypothetical protein
MENRKVEVSLERSVTVGNADKTFEKNRLYVALGAEPGPGEDRKAVAATLFAEASLILDAQFEALTKAAGAAAPSQRLAQATATVMEQANPANAPAKPPQETRLGVLGSCGECGADLKDTPGNRKSMEYAQAKGYAPMCYKCKVAKGIIKPSS